MSNKKNANKNPYTPSAKNRALAEAQRKKNKKKLIIAATVSVMLALAVIITLVAIFAGPKSRSDRMIARAEKLLLTTPYKLVLTSQEDSTDEDIRDTLDTKENKVTLTVDKDAFRFVDPLGDESVTYHYYDGTLYIDESVINVYTKTDISEDELKSLREQYVTPYISVFTAEDYLTREIETDDDGNVIIILKNLKKEIADSLESQIQPPSGYENSGTVMSLDKNETKTIIKLDSEGKYKSIEQIYGFSVDYADGYSALITKTAKKEYTYGDSVKLAAPSGSYIDSADGFKNLFGTSFEITTDITVSTSDSTIANRLYMIGGEGGAFGNITNNILRVDGNNFECMYPGTSNPVNGAPTADGVLQILTLIGDTLYLNYAEKAGDQTYSDKIKQDIDDGTRIGVYGYNVMKNLFPAYARDFLNITKKTDSDGVVTVTCKGITKNIYDRINSDINIEYTSGVSPIRMTPKSDLCEYVVKYDEYGRFLSTELTVTVLCEDISNLSKTSEEKITISRTFDYEKAADYYESVGSAADPWITAPENASDYVNSPLN